LAEFQKKHKPLQITVHMEKILVDFIKPHQNYTHNCTRTRRKGEEKEKEQDEKKRIRKR
jgi:hypothetical protein